MLPIQCHVGGYEIKQDDAAARTNGFAVPHKDGSGDGPDKVHRHEPPTVTFAAPAVASANTSRPFKIRILY